jgi:hypothetical protein
VEWPDRIDFRVREQIDTVSAPIAIARPLSGALAHAFSLTCAGTFAIWIISTDPGDLQQLERALPAYLRAVPFGLAGGIIALVAWANPLAKRFVTALITGSTVLYAGVLKVLDLAALPWILLAAAGVMTVTIVSARRAATNTDWLATLHAMGTLTGLYLAVHLTAFTSAWPSFRTVPASLWRLITG